MNPALLAAVFNETVSCPNLSSAQWEALLGQARRTTLLCRLAAHFEAHGWLASVPSQPRRYLEACALITARQRLETRWEANRIEHALRNVDTPIVLLKGAAYVLAGLPPATSRIFSDIDILVVRERLEEVEGALFAAGWIGQERDPYSERYYRKWMHEIPPLVHATRGSPLDVHHTITPPTSRHAVDARNILGQVRRVGDAGKIYVLAPADMVLHSAVHLFQEGEFDHGMRDLLDMADLLNHFSECVEFRGQLFERARELNLERPLYYALSQLKRTFPRLIADWDTLEFERLRPSGFVARGMSAMLGSAIRPNHPSCDDRFARFARGFLYLRGHLLRMPPHLLVPHLVRKAYLRHFPPTRPDQGEAAV